MKEIQFISKNKQNISAFECTSFSSPKAFDLFEVNIIDLSHGFVFNCTSDNLNTSYLELRNDFKIIKDLILDSHKSNHLVLLPRNINVSYSFYNGKYYKNSELKNELGFIEYFLQLYYFAPSNLEIGFENNSTIIEGRAIISDFYFKNINVKHITKAYKTDKITTIVVRDNLFLTFLQLDNADDIYNFLYQTKIIKKEFEYPKWIYDYPFFNDEQLKDEIKEKKQMINSLEKEIGECENKLKLNLKYKSMLVENDEKLVGIVFETLHEILGVDLSHFNDEKKEDFLFKNEGITYIGEIKGINSGIGNANISQVDNHKSLYEDKLQADGVTETIKKVLIINDQRSKPLDEREPIHINQINKANKEDVIIIRTSSLLKLLELYRYSKITREQMFDTLKIQTGEIKLDNFGKN